MEKSSNNSHFFYGRVAPETLDRHLTRIIGGFLLITIVLFCSAFILPTFPIETPMLTTGIIIILILCFVHSLMVKGRKHTLIFVILSFLFSWFTEFIGCNYSMWFGDYDYTHVLGPMIGNVPILIIFTWEAIIYPSHLLVDWLSGLNKRGYETKPLNALVTSIFAAAATGLLVTAWDTMVDPLAVHLKWWVWEFGGQYFHDVDGGVPLSNYWGWFGAVFIISFVYRFFFARGLTYNKPFRENPLFPLMLYTTWYFNVGYVLFHLKMTMPFFIATFTMGPIILVCWSKYIIEWLEKREP